MTDLLPSDGPPLEGPASPELVYATPLVRPHTWRLAVGIIVVAVASGGLLATLVGIRNSPQWAMNDGLSRAAAVLFYAGDLTGRTESLLFGVAVGCRSRRAWKAAVAYFGIQLIN